MSESAGYRDVLQLSGALQAFLPALVGRLSIATVSLALLFAVEDGTGSFAAAGSALGIFGLANVFSSPVRARLVDRYGQRRTLLGMAAVYALSLTVLVLLLGSGNPELWSVLAAAAAAGASPPPLGAAMRVLWSRLAEHQPPLLTRAYSLDAVADELLFTVGPLIVGVLIATTNPSTSLLVTAVLAATGTAGMVSSPVSGQHLPRLASRTRQNSPLHQPDFMSALIALLGVGAVLGAIEVATPAFAQKAVGLEPALAAGLLLAAFSGGSAIGGLLYGRRHWSASPQQRLVLITAALALFSALLIPVSGMLLLGSVLAAVGFFLAPSLITGYLLADALTTRDVQTEASSWISTATNAGAALAAATGGLIIDQFGAVATFALGTAAAVLATLTAAIPAITSRQR